MMSHSNIDDDLELRERLLQDGNETYTTTAPSEPSSVEPIPSPTAPTTAPPATPASVPTEDLSPVIAPATFPSIMTDPPFPTPTYGYGDDKTQSPPTGIYPQQGDDSPYSASSMSNDSDSTSVLNPFHIIILACIVGVVTFLIFWKFCKAWKLRREKQMLRLQSTRVDAVLGDMQMVGMDEYDDDDPELI